MSLIDYCKLEEPSEVIYFQRAEYDPINQLLKPSYDKWDKICKCMTPFNPDILYLKCDKCIRYYHPNCVGINEEEARKLDVFLCEECKEKEQKIKHDTNNKLKISFYNIYINYYSICFIMITFSNYDVYIQEQYIIKLYNTLKILFVALLFNININPIIAIILL